MGAFKSHLNSHRHLFVNGSGGQRAVTGWVYIYISGYVISNSIHLKIFLKIHFLHCDPVYTRKCTEHFHKTIIHPLCVASSYLLTIPLSSLFLQPAVTHYPGAAWFAFADSVLLSRNSECPLRAPHTVGVKGVPAPEPPGSPLEHLGTCSREQQACVQSVFSPARCTGKPIYCLLNPSL